jgi:pimeloyl-ACP methyl ester carboxylesterase
VRPPVCRRREPRRRRRTSHTRAAVFQHEPSRITAPLCILRGAWDSLCTDADAAWLFDACTAAPLKRDVKLSHGTHLMHLEAGRTALHRDAIAFLCGERYEL